MSQALQTISQETALVDNIPSLDISRTLTAIQTAITRLDTTTTTMTNRIDALTTRTDALTTTMTNRIDALTTTMTKTFAIDNSVSDKFELLPNHNKPKPCNKVTTSQQVLLSSGYLTR